MTDKDTIGLEHGTVRLVPFSDEWKELFEKEKSHLISLLGDSIVDLEHIGSTAIPKIPAKPIIDIAVKLRDEEALKKAIDVLTAAEYKYMGEYGLPGRHFFLKGNPNTHHFHFVVDGSEHWDAWLLFRDFMIEHMKDATDYSDLKTDLAEQFAKDRRSYTKAKGTFIVKALDRAKDDGQ